MIFKRVFDVVLVILSAPLTLLVMFLVALAVWIFDGRPIFFVQKRVGKNEIVFNLYKFRTMAVLYPGALKTDAEELRITRLGSFLRNTSLDELPSLLNILKGDMSFVGPRPLLVEYLPLYNTSQRRRHDVTPGLTGLAQINGRNLIGWGKRIELDVWYVDHHSLALDVKILLKTLKVVCLRKGILSKNGAIMPKFQGEDGE